MQDLRYALRQLWWAPAFSLAAIITLAIGIAATTAIFSAVNATLLRPLPYPHPEQIIQVRTRYLDGSVTAGGLSAVELTALQHAHLPIERAAGMSLAPVDGTLIRDDGRRVGVLATPVTEGFFRVLGLPLVLGTGFTHQDFISFGAGPPPRGTPAAVILSNRMWTSMFDRDPAIIGKPIQIAEIGQPTRIVGVAAPEMDLPHGSDFWFAMRMNPHGTGHGYSVILRMRPGANLKTLNAGANGVLVNLAHSMPEDADAGRVFVMQPLLSSIVGDLQTTLLIVLGATLLLLLLACLNVTNLLLARGAGRTREMAARAALGASRGRLVRYLLTEALVLACAGTILGLGLAWAAVRVLLALGASKLPRLTSIPFDGRVLLFVLAVLVFTVLAMGLAPAWRMSGSDLRTLLNESGRTSTAGRGAARSMSALIVAEIALAIVLAAGAGWLVQSFARLGAVDPGFTPAGRLVIDVNPGTGFPGLPKVQAWSVALLDRIRAVPGVASVGAASTFPFRPNRDGVVNVAVDGAPAQDPNALIGAHIRIVSPGFFQAMGIKVLAGRVFTADDRHETQPVAVVNQAFVHTFLSGHNPIAMQFRYGAPIVIDPKSLHSIVGVVDDVHYESLSEPPQPVFYVSDLQLFPLFRQTVVAEARSGDPAALASGIRSALASFDPNIIPTFEAAPDVIGETLSRQRLGMTLMLIFGALALALAAIGIYGVIAYASTQRRDELATRLALGATGGRVFWLVMNGGQRLALVGVAIGLIGAYAGGRLLASSVYAMRAADPLILAAAALIVAVVAFLATMIPAVRASRLEPVRALRPE